MPAACLPATGIDTWTIALLIAGAAMLLAMGVVAVRRSRRGIALGIVPLLLLGVVLAAPAAPAQAITVAYPGFTVGTTDIDDPSPWFESPDNVWALDQALTPEQEATLADLAEMINADDASLTIGDVQFATLVDPPQTTTQPSSSVVFAAELYYPTVTSEAVDAAVDALNDLNLSMTVTYTYDYQDDCGRPLQTVIVFTGLLAFVS